MPKDLFFLLNKEKQKVIIDCALKEFSDKSLENASINQIVANSQISRGAFYLYFENKEDIYMFVVGQQLQLFRMKLMKEYKPATFKDFFLAVFDSLLSDKLRNKKFLKQFINNLSFKNLKILSCHFSDCKTFNKENMDLNITGYEEDIDLYFEICMPVVCSSLFEIIMGNSDVIKSRDKLNKKLDIILNKRKLKIND